MARRNPQTAAKRARELALRERRECKSEKSEEPPVLHDARPPPTQRANNETAAGHSRTTVWSTHIGSPQRFGWCPRKHCRNTGARGVRHRNKFRNCSAKGSRPCPRTAVRRMLGSSDESRT